MRGSNISILERLINLISCFLKVHRVLIEFTCIFLLMVAMLWMVTVLVLLKHLKPHSSTLREKGVDSRIASGGGRIKHMCYHE